MTVLAAAVAAAASPAQASYDDHDYWAFADRMQQRLDPLWDESAGYYRAGPGGVEPMTNSLLLLSHSVAAAQGHEGPARNDRRSGVLASRLVDGLPYVTRPPATAKAGLQTHAPGRLSSMTSESARSTSCSTRRSSTASPTPTGSTASAPPPGRPPGSPARPRSPRTPGPDRP